MSVAYGFLGLLEQRPHHGYQLKRLFDRWFPRNPPLPFGQVYATLSRLEREGKVIIDRVEQAEGPVRKRYALTESGERDLDAWLTEPLEPEPHLQSELYAKVAVAALSGRSIDRLLDAQRHAHLEQMRKLTAARRDSSLPIAMLADYALFHLEADLRWIEMSGARADELRGQLASASPEPPPSRNLTRAVAE
jgi:DNA-binding PadR family transcriptional regulator